MFQDSLRDVFFKAGVGRKSDEEDDDNDNDVSPTPTKAACLDDTADRDPDVARLENDALSLLLRPTPGGITGQRPSAASLGIMDSIEECLAEKGGKGELQFSLRIVTYYVDALLMWFTIHCAAYAKTSGWHL